MVEPVADDGPVPDFYSPRELTYITPAGRRISDYEAAICHAQADYGQYDTGNWFLLRSDGRGVFDAGTTAVQHPNWFDYRDPSGLWQRTYVRRQAEQERSIAAAIDVAKQTSVFADMDHVWTNDVLARYYEAIGCLEWGLYLAHTRPVRESLSDTLAMALVFSAADRLRHQQAIALYSLDLEEECVGYQGGLGKDAWLHDPALQPARWVVEALMANADWVETMVAVNLVFDPLFVTFALGHLLRRSAPLNGDALTPQIIGTVERDRIRNREATAALLKMLLQPADRRGSSVPVSDNRQLIQQWLEKWASHSLEATQAFAAVFELPPAIRIAPEAALAETVLEWEQTLGRLTLELPKGVASR